MMLLSAESEHLGLTDRENYFRRISTYVNTIHQRHRQTDRRADRRRAIARPRFAL